MVGEKFKTAFENGNIVIVAGAGISKDQPANLPSWWDYNLLLIESIGKIGAEVLGKSANLLDMNMVLKHFPVVSVSDFFVNRIAGNSYFPLLEMLDGAEPNEHHLTLAKLAKEKHITGIVTTNFDTLIEQAFEKMHVPYTLYSVDEDYQKQDSFTGIPICKIHGSAEKAIFSIDTVQQKLQGLSVEKKYMLRKLFLENHILFIGFSGEDFLFGSDYIPVKANKSNDYGITWIAYPGSSFNKQVTELIKELQINVLITTLQEFYKTQKWEIPEVVLCTKCKNSFREIATEKINKLLKSPHIGDWACVGMCLELLDRFGESKKAEEIASITKDILRKKNQVNIIDVIGRISIYSALAEHSLRNERSEEACEFFAAQMQIFRIEDELVNEILKSQKNDFAYRERMMNRSSAINRYGTILLNHFGRFPEARKIFLQVFKLAYEAMYWENISIALFNIAMCDYKHWKIEKELKLTVKNNFIAILESAAKVAKRSGSAQGIFETNSYLAVMYAAFGQKKLFEQALKKAENVMELCVGKTENSTFLQFLKEKTQYFQEDAPWPENYIGLCGLHDYSNEWKPFGDRPILKFKEGKYAKKLFDSGKQYESIKYLEDKMRHFIDSDMLEEADAFSNCLAGILLEKANNLRMDNLIEESVKTRNNCKIFYEQCLELEYNLGRFDYLPSTLGELSMLNSYEDSLDMLERGLFQAELCLCFCDNPLECWQVVLAVEAACIINIKMNKRGAAMEYCKKYFEMIHIAPWVTYPENIVEMKRIYDDLVRST